MGKTSQKRLMRRQGQANNIGCMSGLIRMFYSRHDAKLLLDRKQGSTRHTFTGFTGRGHSRKNSRDLDEIDEDGNICCSYVSQNMEECSSSKPTVKRLMEDELAGKVKRLKIPNDEVQRILADLGHDVCLDKRSTQNNKSKGDQNHSTSITVSAPSRRLDPSGSNSMEEAEENELEFALADLLGQIQRYHDEQPHKNCRNKGELCTELKVLIQKKLNELDNPPCSLGYEQTPQGEEKDTADGKRLRSSSVTRPKQFRDTFEMLSSDTELLFKIPEKSNSHNLESVQRHENRQIGTGLVPTKMPENTKDTKSPSQHELVTKTRGRESRHIFFWKKERPNRTHTAEGTNSSQPVNKIVILKPNTIGGANPAVAVSSTDQYPELSAAESSKFSITEVRRRFRIVTSEARKGKPTVCEDGLQKHPHWFKKSAFTIKKDTRQLAEQTSEEKALSTGTKDFRSSSMSRKKQRHDGPSEINSNIMASPKDESAFYDEAKKHLTEILKDKSQTAKYPILQRTRSLDMVEEAEAVKEHVAMVTSPPGNDVPECQEPTTPRSSAPIELISQFSPDGNHEKQEQPSPVSVLYPFLHEDVDSPNNENIIKCELNEDILRSQYTTADGSDHGVFWEDKDVRLGYIEELLELSELCRYQNLEVWYLEDELISPCLFEELHQGNQIDDMKLLFDCICEAVTEVQGIYFSPACLSPLKRNIRAPPTGRNLISEINKQVERHLHYQFPSTLDQLVIMDLEGGSWMNLGPESEEITVVIWDCILDELLEEAVYDLWI
ncbi:uncharacterized protein LOC112874238 isoform X4 [Panicum hallii]|uniref:uncharacterized protein LOC112874238 isoform X4 n=1 Tax=Panicum hallii TaxID=206008 RepID=UPI000DF4E366|nr:uncharacterized protein LOC112874238 isoform X4 [Panicum hallii]